MAVFNINTDCLTNADYSSAEDIKKVKSYLYRLNDQLQYMFSNLTTEDNLSAEAAEEYTSTVEAVSNLEQTVKGKASEASIKVLEDEITLEVTRAESAESSLSSRITQNADNIALKVNSSDLGNSSLTIKPAEIDIESGGTINLNAGSAINIESGGSISIKSGSTFTVASNNFSINGSGDVTLTGNISGSTIEGSTLKIKQNASGSYEDGIVVYTPEGVARAQINGSIDFPWNSIMTSRFELNIPTDGSPTGFPYLYTKLGEWSKYHLKVAMASEGASSGDTPFEVLYGSLTGSNLFSVTYQGYSSKMATAYVNGELEANSIYLWNLNYHKHSATGVTTNYLIEAISDIADRLAALEA